MLIAAGTYYRWIASASDAAPQLAAASWLAFALALAWLTVRSVAVWRQAPARP